MKRDELRALGLTDEQIDAIMGMHGTSVQNLQTQLATSNASLIKAQGDLTALQNAQNVEPKEPEQPIDPEMAELQRQLEELKRENRIKDLRAYAADNKITGEQADLIINALGSDLESGKNAIDSIAKIISETSESVKKQTEQMLINTTPNPQGASTGGVNSKPDDVKNAESISFGKIDDNAKTVRDYYK